MNNILSEKEYQRYIIDYLIENNGYIERKCKTDYDRTKAGYNSEQFIKQFMTSSLAKELDSTYNRMQWAGEEYLLEEFADRCPNAPKDGKLYDNEVLYWAGYVYRYWHFLTGESSKDIYKQAPAETMNTNYLMFHCMDTELAIEDLKEIHQQKVKKRSKSGRKAMSDMIQSD